MYVNRSVTSSQQGGVVELTSRRVEAVDTIVRQLICVAPGSHGSIADPCELGVRHYSAAVVTAQHQAVSIHARERAVVYQRVFRPLDKDPGRTLQRPVATRGNAVRLHEALGCIPKMKSRESDTFDRVLKRAFERDQCLQACRNKLAIGWWYTCAVVVDVEAFGLWRVVYSQVSAASMRWCCTENTMAVQFR